MGKGCGSWFLMAHAIGQHDLEDPVDVAAPPGQTLLIPFSWLVNSYRLQRRNWNRTGEPDHPQTVVDVFFQFSHGWVGWLYEPKRFDQQHRHDPMSEVCRCPQSRSSLARQETSGASVPTSIRARKTVLQVVGDAQLTNTAGVKFFYACEWQ